MSETGVKLIMLRINGISNDSHLYLTFTRLFSTLLTRSWFILNSRTQRIRHLLPIQWTTRDSPHRHASTTSNRTLWTQKMVQDKIYNNGDEDVSFHFWLWSKPHWRVWQLEVSNSKTHMHTHSHTHM